jgi:hypothetical protein
MAALLLAWGNGATGPALAQEAGSHIVRPGPAQGPSGGLGAADSGRMALPAYAACLVEHDRAEIERVIARFPDEKEQTALWRLADADCLSSGELTMTDQLLRGALYAELYRRSYAYHAPSIAGASIDWWADTAAQEPAAANNFVALRQFAECLVQKHPEESRQLMLVPPRSRREDEALGAMTPDMGPCLVAGAELKFSKPVLEGLIAEALYRLSVKGAAAAGTSHASK